MNINYLIEGNQIIAKFMGYKLAYPSNGNIMVKYDDETDHFGIDDPRFCYHKDWGLLMPVVEKIEAIKDKHHGHFGVHISSNNCSIQGTNLWKYINNSSYGPVYLSDPNAIFSTKLESTWHAVVSFLSWYKLYKSSKKKSKEISKPVQNSLAVILGGHGNPDMRQYADLVDIERKPCNTLREASMLSLRFIETNNLGAGNWVKDCGIIYHPIKGAIARVSYNGRVWHGTNISLDSKEFTGDDLDKSWDQL